MQRNSSSPTWQHVLKQISCKWTLFTFPYAERCILQALTIWRILIMQTQHAVCATAYKRYREGGIENLWHRNSYGRCSQFLISHFVSFLDFLMTSLHSVGLDNWFIFVIPSVKIYSNCNPQGTSKMLASLFECRGTTCQSAYQHIKLLCTV